MLGALIAGVPIAPTTHADSIPPLAPGQLAWWADRLEALDRPAKVAEAQVALAGRSSRQALAEQSRNSACTREIAQQRWRLERELGRIDLERAELAHQRTAVESRVGAALAAFGRRQPSSGRELSQTRLVLADMVRLVATLRGRAERLAVSRARRALALRATVGEAGLRQAEGAAAGERLWVDGRRWQAARLVWTEIEAHRDAARRAVRPLKADLEVANEIALARSPEPAVMVPARKDHKRAIELEARLDRSLLRAVGGWPAFRPARRIAAAPERLGQRGTTAARLLLPIAGVIEPGVRPPEGGPAHGLSIVSGIGQTVSAPVAGTVAYAAPFPGFDLLLIIDEGRGYHIVLSGMTQLDVRQGASVVAGQAIGEIAAQGDEPARLYVELRYRGLPVDPAPWLAAHQDKVRS
ncbi:MAG: murein hydrolase activator EnvC family protein [Geminicoccaceae bacterium]